MFITIESLDGGGGTTVVQSIKEEYPNAVFTQEPTESTYGRFVREQLSDEDTDSITDFYLFMADRRDHIENVIKPADEKGKLVVSDRYADSTRAYQPVALAGDSDEKPFDSRWEAKFFIEQTMARWNREPDLTLYIDVSVDTAIERSAGNEKYEECEFLKQVKANYDALADTKERIIRIDGEQSKDEVRRQALAKLDVVAPDRL